MSGHRGRGGGRARSHERGGSRRGNKSRNNNGLDISRQEAFDHQEFNQDLPERFRKGKSHDYRSRNQQSSSSSRNDFHISLNKEIRKYIEAENSLQATDDKEVWIEASEIPESSEIQLATDDIVGIAPNKPSSAFKNVPRYLKTHYSLLREDAVGPLRDAIDKFRADPEMDDDTDLSIYEKVYVKGFTFTNADIAARIQFSTRRAGRKILWSASKRLVAGSLVALSPEGDNFVSTCIVAIVAARPLYLLEESPPSINVYFATPNDIQIDPQIKYVMIEARTGYFESYRHTLKALQKMSRESFPLSPHITGVNDEIGPPQYLAEHPNISLAPAFENSDDSMLHFASVDVVNNWPQTPQGTTLDPTQWAALETILTKKLAIVQGPPGTGKTYVSKIALQILVQNRKDGDPPIIVAAHTNHALDQLLKHIAKFEPEYVRLGGRSTSAEVKKRALYEIRQQEKIPQIPGSLFLPAKRELEREQVKYGEILSIFDENSDVISDEKLLQLGIISAAQQKSLIDAVNDWVTTEKDSSSPIKHWLHKALIPFEVVYEADTFGFEDVEEDLEIEQLRETDAEHGVTDEEDIEVLKGRYEAVSDNWTVPAPSKNDLAKATHMLASKEDLYDIPEYLRGPVYHVMKQRAKQLALDKFRKEAVEYAKVCQKMKIGRWERDEVYLKRANIIGMTTTGLSKYRPLIASLKPKIVLIEEAAEEVEGPVTAACMESVEHLILVGDHQQLRGRCALLELENDPFFLNVSMFERLVNLQMPFKTLLRQRRMNSDIRELVSLLYPKLQDHESVATREQPPPWGTGLMRTFFFHHAWSELRDQSMSVYNEEEARMIAKFYRHLLRHGVPPPAITILTFYNGQRKRILRELKNDSETNGAYNMVKTVDSYQGEENDIVILSLVRNNTHGQIGFLDINNRVCVALSRAKFGFYIFGNGYLLSEKSELWSYVGKTMSEPIPPLFGEELPLTCVNHGQVYKVQWPEHFDQHDGGCDLPCGAELPCGHVCPRHCHPMPHHQLQCDEICCKKLRCGHNCQTKCHEMCYCDCDSFQNISHSTIAHHDSSELDLITTHPSQLDPSLFIHNNDGRRSSSKLGKPLARGGAAFQPIVSPNRTDMQLLMDQLSMTDDDHVHATPNKFQDWNAFASGGVKEDDEYREKMQTPNKIAKSTNLIDVSPDNEGGTIEHEAEMETGTGRKRFTQTFRPAVPEELGSPRMRHKNSKKGNANVVPNLMD